jgi:DNA-binding NtrC family response regulator
MGTGKELVARTLHYRSRRALQPFVMLNCGAITESLLASELFGILPNVATDVKARPGRFVEASGGTLFLDEVGEMPMAQQVALLSVLSSSSTRCEVTPVGGGKPVPVDVRVIAATNQDLRARIRDGKFREDLYYRLAVIPIEIPPLRERKADIQPLAARFLKEFAATQQRPAPEMSPEFVAALLRSDWPGNVRELQNYVERVLAMTPGKTLHPRPMPRDLEERAGTVQLRGGRRLNDMVEELERKLIRDALDRANGNQSRAARELGLTEQSMRYRIKKYRLESAREKQRTR